MMWAPVLNNVVAIGVLLTYLTVYGSEAGRCSGYSPAPTLVCFAVALLFFTAHYVALRGLYALEANQVILGIQVVVGLVNLGLALVLVAVTDQTATAPALAIAYAGANAVGCVLSWSVLAHKLGRSEHRANLASVARTGLCAAVAMAGCLALVQVTTGHPVVPATSKEVTLLRTGAVTATFAALFLATARLLQLPEVQLLRAAVRRERASSPGGQ